MQVKLYLFNAKTQQKYPINGSKVSDRPVDALPIQALVSAEQSELPRAVDLRPFMSPVERQADTNTCVANSLVGAYEYLLGRYSNNTIDMSRLFVYYNARERDEAFGGVISDSGCFIGDAIEALKEFGTCTEDRWKFDERSVNTKPTPDCYEEAKQYIVMDAVEVGVDQENMKMCLARGFPFIFSLKLFQSFARAAKNGGIVSTPELDEPALDSMDQHAMLAVGYNDDREVFVVRNSWGPEWGDAGYCYIPYPYLANPDYCSEVFAIRKLANFDLNRDHWLDDPSQMQIGFPNLFGSSGDNGEDDWTVISEPLESSINFSSDGW